MDMYDGFVCFILMVWAFFAFCCFLSLKNHFDSLEKYLLGKRIKDD